MTIGSRGRRRISSRVAKSKSSSRVRKGVGKSVPDISPIVSDHALTVPPGFPIIGIGASAGGLEAIEEFLGNIPLNTGICFVIVQHLDPERKSFMAELLQRMTPMKVVEARDRMRARPDTVIVLPSNLDIGIRNFTLRLAKPTEPRGLRLPIDGFFRSLALDRQEEAIGVILSGMGSDGSHGLKIIKEYAGAIFVQDPAQAGFDSMPRAAIETGFVDVVASARDLPKKILEYLHRVRNLSGAPAATDDQQAGNSLERILALLKSRAGHDFSLYKMASVRRRIERRMGLVQVKAIPEYVRLLKEDPREIEVLARDLLIGVTSFFRDPEVWEALKRKALPSLLASRRGHAAMPIRAWVAGCSTGEEAYSLVMILKEAMEKAGASRGLSIHVFATDLDAKAIEKARAGMYPAGIEADVSPARLRRFFTREEKEYRVNQEIREAVTFAPHNLVTDPPFSRLDILTCRNLLIYFSPELQKKILPVFHYALAPGGIMILGSSETIGSHTDLFTPLSASNRIYLRGMGPVRQGIEFPSSFNTARPPTGARLVEPSKSEARKKSRGRVAFTVEDFQTAEEELKSANEELQSANEELQSTNEELTTSKEELQSMNEELQTVNQELRSKGEDLAEFNSDLLNFMNSADAATIFLDSGLNIRRFTNRATEIMKMIPSDVGRPLTDLASGLDYPELEEDAMEVLRTLQSLEKTVASRDGRWFMTRIVPYRTPANVISGVVLNFTDISERLKAEEARIRAERLAAVGRLAAGVAHEFNNVLSIIRNHAQILEMEPFLDGRTEILEKLAIIDEMTQRGREVTESMMALSSPASEKKMRLNVEEIVSRVLAVQKKGIEIAGIRVRIAIPEGVTITAEKSRIQQVILNLVLNARDAMKSKQGGVMTISAEETPEGVRISVADTGIGMSEQELKMLFTPFYTTKGAYARDNQDLEGHGLGLAISFAIMQEHGGRLDVESVPGGGTTFTLVFPRESEHPNRGPR